MSSDLIAVDPRRIGGDGGGGGDNRSAAERIEIVGPHTPVVCGSDGNIAGMMRRGEGARTFENAPVTRQPSPGRRAQPTTTTVTTHLPSSVPWSPVNALIVTPIHATLVALPVG